MTESELLHRMAALCSGSEHCIQDIQKKMASADLPPEAKERIMARLLQEKFIDEERFCRSFVRDKIRFNKWGKVKVGYELRRRNIPYSCYADALDAFDMEEYRAILSGLLREKKRSVRGKDQREVFYKLLRFAAGRGFESNETIRCLKELDIETDDYEENTD
ncbi:regulatory protein [Parabacteroides sp. PFB2-10]|uniref:regulatory protein RecX n=1 Tax=Parabacteroides sp. PFB2-10 TaxID=1742405 RepID=UPI002475BF46|nr:regulatory protein RecX [Parabacteroides sp. PFB2-10]MDH6311484.1 regulatory protein [Parabacteroides sp. PFB2-10]MDL2245605.1 RecX family transcriptional regulator [Parabacteroides sp. OttesenSCG-928-J18]